MGGRNRQLIDTTDDGFERGPRVGRRADLESGNLFRIAGRRRQSFAGFIIDDAMRPSERPWILPGSLSVRDGRDRYVAENGFDLDAYSASTYEIDLEGVVGFVLTLKNRESRRRAIPLHDLHHVATGYGTDLVGEAEIGAFELVAGCDSLFLWWINGSAVLLGLVLAPVRVLRAARRAIGQRTLYRGAEPYESVLGLTVGELRESLRLPPDGAADRPPRLHRRAPRPDRW